MTQYITIEGFESLTKQQMFDMSAKYVLANGRRSTNDGGCIYSGIGCAAAPFIKPEYREDADRAEAGSSWSFLCSADLVPGHNSGLVSAMQQCHDSAGSACFVGDFKKRMLEVAKWFNLSADVLKTGILD